jgi:hypothetical protein
MIRTEEIGGAGDLLERKNLLTKAAEANKVQDNLILHSQAFETD